MTIVTTQPPDDQFLSAPSQQLAALSLSSEHSATELLSPRYESVLFDPRAFSPDDVPDPSVSRIVHSGQVGLRMPVFRIFYFVRDRLQIQGYNATFDASVFLSATLETVLMELLKRCHAKLLYFQQTAIVPSHITEAIFEDAGDGWGEELAQLFDKTIENNAEWRTLMFDLLPPPVETGLPTDSRPCSVNAVDDSNMFPCAICNSLSALSPDLRLTVSAVLAFDTFFEMLLQRLLELPDEMHSVKPPFRIVSQRESEYLVTLFFPPRLAVLAIANGREATSRHKRIAQSVAS